jgi:predicted nucleotidyltransferase
VKSLNLKQVFSVCYHDIFDYPLTQKELSKWKAGRKVSRIKNLELKIGCKSDFYFLKGREEIVKRRLQREKYSKGKLKIALKAARLLSLVPSVKMVAITGSLAMSNADANSDIDLLIITKNNSLWTTRVMAFLFLKLNKFALRTPGVKNEKDKLCLNIWLDESDPVWSNKNLYTAHEICQIIPLANKNKTYERFIAKNSWVQDFWPNALKTSSKRRVATSKTGKSLSNPILHSTYYILQIFEPLAYFLQRLYMRGKISKEVVGPTRAIFHPRDLSRFVASRLQRFAKFS